MAAKGAGLNFEEFNIWSASAGNYAGENDCRTVWKSFTDSGRVTPASLFGMAFSQGWKDPAKGLTRGAIASIKTISRVQPKGAIQVKSEKATTVWELCEPATEANEYILKKGGLPDGLRVYPIDAPTLLIQGQNVAGWLVVPCISGDKLQTLQFIPSEGKKLNLPGATFNDGFFAVGDIAGAGRIDIVEGIGQAWACNAVTGDAAVVCFGVGRMATVAEGLRAKYPNKRLIVVPDCGKENQAGAIAAVVNCEWCELPDDKPGNYDVHNYLMDHGATELLTLLNRTKTPPMRFQLLSGVELSNATPMRWMVRGVLPLDGLAALYGASGSGKSFLVLDIAAFIAGGEYEWFGRRVTQCPVTYCALEGEAGMGKRVKAWSLHHKKPVPDSLRFITQPFDILAGGDIAELTKAIQAAGGAGGLVILDTLNRAAPGADENSSVDMGNIIAAAKRIQSLVGGLVLLVHHTGKDVTRGLRGHSSLYAALDGAIEVTKSDSRREWSVAKSKDDETGTVHAFALDVITVGLDDEGEEITSCIAVPDETVDAVKRVKLPSGGNQKIALDTLGEPIRTSKEFNKDGAPHGHPCIRLDAAILLVAERLVCDAKRRTERARATINDMVAKGIYGVKEDWLWRI
jgi:hypothetical protein